MHEGFSRLPPDVRHQFEKLKSSIILKNGGQRFRRILLTSYHPGEGTTTIAGNFARVLAEDRRYRVLLLDANTRAPGLASNGAERGKGDAVEFSDLFERGVENWSLPKPSSESNLTVIGSGSVVHHPSQVFDHKRFSKFMAGTLKLFHFVILDSSPIGRYYDAMVLAPHVDGIILVVEAERTQLSELKWARQMLQEKNLPILGVVLNRRRFRIPSLIFHRFF